MIKFNNNNSIDTIQSASTTRGNRSKFISCMCLDMQNNEFVFVADLDIRKPFDRFVPEWVVNQIIKERERINEN